MTEPTLEAPRDRRPGFVVTFVANSLIFEDAESSPSEREAAAVAMRDLVPALDEVGLFEIFRPRSAEVCELIRSVLPDVDL